MGHLTRAAILALALSGLACLWDTDTLRDEMQTQADVFDLITGQFPHHGKAYYEARIRKSLAALERDPSSREIRNDLAAGYLRVGRFQDALREFERLRQELPGDYKTLSNLGVLYKKMGEFGKAADFTAQALAIKPEGHLGLGDWYLKMLRYRRDTTAPGAVPPEMSFLGTPYREFPTVRLTGEDYKNLELLIRADRTFPDAFLVLGDYLHRERHLNLALWAYASALELGHPQTRELDRRMDLIFGHWKQAFENERLTAEDPKEVLRGVREGLKTAAGWLKSFERVEAELVSQGGTVDYETVERALTTRGIARFCPADREGYSLEAGPATAGRARPDGRRSLVFPVLLAGLLLPALLGVWAYRRSHRPVRRFRPAIRASRA